MEETIDKVGNSYGMAMNRKKTKVIVIEHEPCTQQVQKQWRNRIGTIIQVSRKLDNRKMAGDELVIKRRI